MINNKIHFYLNLNNMFRDMLSYKHERKLTWIWLIYFYLAVIATWENIKKNFILVQKFPTRRATCLKKIHHVKNFIENEIWSRQKQILKICLKYIYIYISLPCFLAGDTINTKENFAYSVPRILNFEFSMADIQWNIKNQFR